VSSLVIRNATVVSDPLSGAFTPNCNVIIEGGEIVSVSRDAPGRASRGATRLDGSGMLLLPGLIDAHTHLYASLTLGMPGKGKPPRSFPEVLRRVWWKWDKLLKHEDVYVSALVGCLASIRNGITTIVDHHASPSAIADSLSWVAAGAEACGLRACLAYEVTDRGGKRRRDEGIRENRRFLKDVRSGGSDLLRGLFGMHAVFSLSDESLRRCADEANDLGVGCHMHVAEHSLEVERFAEDHPEGIFKFLSRIGVLGPTTLLAHTVHLSRRDVRDLIRTGTFNVHNPLSNMGNGVGIAPIAEMLALGQPVGLGSDGFYDIPREMVIARSLQTLGERNPSGFSDEDSLRLVYDHNARFVGRLYGHRFGKVAPGYTADLILLDYEPATPLNRHNCASHILAALGGGTVDTSIIAGRVVMRGREIQTVDEQKTLAKARGVAQGIWDRL
jgi:putative selenium metabolism protein SsnA